MHHQYKNGSNTNCRCGDIEMTTFFLYQPPCPSKIAQGHPSVNWTLSFIKRITGINMEVTQMIGVKIS